MNHSQLSTFEKRSNLALFGQWLTGATIAMARAIGGWLFPIAKWKWVGSSDALYRRELEQHGFQIIGELAVDRETMPNHLGSFGTKWRYGAIPVENDRYFYPAQNELERAAVFEKLGYGFERAREIARIGIMEDLKVALQYGERWFLYRLTVKVKRGSRVLSEISLSGIDAVPHAEEMDPRIEQLFLDLVPEAENEAINELRALCDLSLRSY